MKFLLLVLTLTITAHASPLTCVRAGEATSRLTITVSADLKKAAIVVEEEVVPFGELRCARPLLNGPMGIFLACYSESETSGGYYVAFETVRGAIVARLFQSYLYGAQEFRGEFTCVETLETY